MPKVLAINENGIQIEQEIGGGIAAIDLLTFTPSQSSVYDAPGTVNLGTYEKLTDDNATTGAGTQNSGFQWIKADIGSLKYVQAIQVAPGSLGGGFGDVAPYITNRSIEVSSDDSTWIQVRGTGVITAATWLSIGLYCRYVRLSITNSWVATTSFKILGA